MIWAEDGRSFIDFFAGAGGLNYGHNPEELKQPLLEYISGDGITHGLDMATAAKESFLERFDEVILKPRGLRLQRGVPRADRHQRGRGGAEAGAQGHRPHRIVSFTNGFHGMTLGALALTGNRVQAQAAPACRCRMAPRCRTDGYMGDEVDSLAFLDAHARRRRVGPGPAGGGDRRDACRARAASTPPASTGCAVSPRSASAMTCC